MTARWCRGVAFLCAGLLVLAGCNDAAQPIVSNTQQFKVLVDGDGLYRITGAALQSAGANVSALDSNSLALSRDGRSVPIRVGGERQSLSIDFYAAHTAVPDAPAAAYLLSWGGQPGARMEEADIPSAPQLPPQTTYTQSLAYSNPALYVPQSGEPLDHWFWQALPAPITTSLNITLTDNVQAAAQLSVRLWGSTQDDVQPNHHIRLELDGQSIADESWAGKGERNIAAAIPATLVTSGVHALRLIAPGDTGAAVDIVLLKDMRVDYRRKLIAQAGALDFSGGAGAYQVDGLAGEAATLYDVSSPGLPVIVKNATFANAKLSFSQSGAGLHHWIAATSGGYRAPHRIVAVPPDTLHNAAQQADYLIISHPDFVPGLKPLVDLRQKDGLRVAVVTTEAIYNAFGGGEESARAIRAFLAYAYANWQKPAPRFVLLVGKASYDIHDYLKGPNKNLAPTILLPTLNLGETGVDNALVSFDEAMLKPSLAVGRLPVKTSAQLATAIDKIVAYENAATSSDAWRARALFVADDKEEGFASLADDLIGRLPAGVTPTRAYLGATNGALAPTKQKIIDAWNQGAALVTYVGHGSINLWAQGPLFTAADGNALKNGDRLPFLLTPTCLDGYFLDAQQDSLAEQLLFKKDGGIIAGLVPTGLSFPPNQRKLAGAFADALFGTTPLSVGEAMMRAKLAMTIEGPGDNEVIETFTLLGDPALKLAIGLP